MSSGYCGICGDIHKDGTTCPHAIPCDSHMGSGGSIESATSDALEQLWKVGVSTKDCRRFRVVDIFATQTVYLGILYYVRLEKYK